LSGAEARGRVRRAPFAACVAVFALAVTLRVVWFGVAERSPDELLYTQFGHGIAHEGLAWFPRTVAQYTAEINFEYPWVHRAGFLSLVALAQIVSGRHDPVAGELLSFTTSVATVGLTGVLAWNLLSPWSAALAMLFLAVSPLDLALARRAWQDDVVAFATLVIAALLLKALARPAERRWRVGFFAVCGLSLLIKESVAIPFGLGGLALAWDAWVRTRDVRRALVPLGWGAAVTALVVGAVVALCGGLGQARELLAMTPAAWAPDAYLREYQTGGVGYYVTGLRILQPLPWLLGCVAAALAVGGAPWLGGPWNAASGGRALRVLGGYVLIFLIVSCVYSSKNMRFLSPIYSPVAMLAASLVRHALTWLRARVPLVAWRGAAALTAGLLLFAAWSDAKRFDHYFNDLQIQDLATPWFTKADAGLL
jgi:4-amino-4-deoxy-L-arabinose transferase-like glycosyltransferase